MGVERLACDECGAPNLARRVRKGQRLCVECGTIYGEAVLRLQSAMAPEIARRARMILHETRAHRVAPTS